MAEPSDWPLAETAVFGQFHAGVESIRIEGAPFGLTPLHARVENGEVCVARRAHDLTSSAHASVDVDRICALLMFAPPPAPTTSLFAGVIRIAPDATTILSSDGRVVVTPRSRALPDLALDPVDAANELWKRVVDSVSRCIGNSKHVAVLTGGGVDSSAVLAAAVAVCRGANRAEVDAIALHFAGEGDDRPHLAELEKELGLVAIKVAPRDGAAAMLPLLTCPTMPVWSWSSPTDYALFVAARDCGAQVALTGLGGDDLFDGTPRLLGDDFARGRFGALRMAARLGPSEDSPSARIKDFIFRPVVGRMIPLRLRRERRLQSVLRDHPWAGPTLRRFIESDCARWKLPTLDTPTSRFDALAKATYIADGVELCEEVARRTQMRLAHPFLDQPLVELMSALPPRVLLHADRMRGLFRLAARGHVPGSVRLRSTKANFLNAWRETLTAAGGRKILENLATVSECAKLGIVEPAGFRARFENLERDEVSWTQLWPVLGIEGFLRARAALRSA